jgi:hypothetical protein
LLPPTDYLGYLAALFGSASRNGSRPGAWRVNILTSMAASYRNGHSDSGPERARTMLELEPIAGQFTKRNQSLAKRNERARGGNEINASMLSTARYKNSACPLQSEA